MHISSKTNNPSTFQSSNFKTINPSSMNNIESINIKQNQMISTIMDTIQQKTDDPNSLKMSLRKFDLQLLTMYVSTKSQLGANELYQKDNSMTPIKPYQNNPAIPQQQQNYRSSSTQYKPSQQHHNSTKKLSIPKPNTLTDKFMQQVLGPQEQLMTQYDRTVNPMKYEQQVKDKMRDNIRQQWRRNATSCDRKISNNNNVMVEFQDRRDEKIKIKAFYDQQYYTYIKTNMKYLAEMNTHKNTNNVITNQFYTTSNDGQHCSIQHQYNSPHRHYISSNDSCQHADEIWTSSTFTQPLSPFLQKDPSQIVKKIQQTGGIEITIGKMERSLKKNQIKHLKVNEYLQKKHIGNIHKKQMQFVNSTSKRLTLDYHNLESRSIVSRDFNTIDKTSKLPQHVPKLQQKQSLNSTQHSFFNNDAGKASSFVVQDSIGNAQPQVDRQNWREKSQSMRKLIEKSIGKY